MSIGALGIAGTAATVACPATAGGSCILAVGAFSAAASGITMLLYSADTLQEMEISYYNEQILKDYWLTAINEIKIKDTDASLQLIKLLEGENLLTLNEVIKKTLEI